MVDVSLTAADVQATANTRSARGTAGETITAGEWVYLKASDSKLWLADVDALATAAVVGMALNDAAAGQPVEYATGGDVDVGSAEVTQGTIYVLSDSGAMAPAADLASNDYVTVLGIGKDGNTLTLSIKATGVQVP